MIEINYQEDIWKEANRIGIDADKFTKNFFKYHTQSESDYKSAFFPPSEESNLSGNECWEHLISLRPKLVRYGHYVAHKMYLENKGKNYVS